MSTAYQLVRDALVELDIPREEIAPEAELRGDLDVDSTELVEVVASINAKSGTRVNSKSIKGIRTVGQLAELIEKAGVGSAVES